MLTKLIYLVDASVYKLISEATTDDDAVKILAVLMQKDQAQYSLCMY